MISFTFFTDFLWKAKRYRDQRKATAKKVENKKMQINVLNIEWFFLYANVS